MMTAATMTVAMMIVIPMRTAPPWHNAWHVDTP
jgi:hypothetical protein